MLLRLVVETYDGRAVVRASGEVDLATADRLTSVVRAAFGDGYRTVLADLTDVTFLDSSGTTALLACARSARRHGGRFAVVAPDSRVSRLLHILGTEDEVAVHRSLDDALRATATEPPAPGD
jgi:anti-sigma B factor antagonist